MPLVSRFRGLLRSDSLIGTAVLKLQPLESKVTVHEACDVSLSPSDSLPSDRTRILAKAHTSFPIAVDEWKEARGRETGGEGAPEEPDPREAGGGGQMQVARDRPRLTIPAVW